VIKPYYPGLKGASRRPVGFEKMLSIHSLQHWFHIQDPAAEEAFYDSRAMRSFVGINLEQEPVPDEMTICKFRYFMKHRKLGGELFNAVVTPELLIKVVSAIYVSVYHSTTLIFIYYFHPYYLQLSFYSVSDALLPKTVSK